MPAPSPRPYPSASASKVLHRPSAAVAPAASSTSDSPGEVITRTPPASATGHSPARSACTARCSDTSDEEQAVSTAMLGPRRSRACDTRLATPQWAVPIPVHASIRGRSSNSLRP